MVCYSDDQYQCFDHILHIVFLFSRNRVKPFWGFHSGTNGKQGGDESSREVGNTRRSDSLSPNLGAGRPK